MVQSARPAGFARAGEPRARPYELRKHRTPRAHMRAAIRNARTPRMGSMRKMRVAMAGAAP
jgi:hypothetical protein